VIKMRLRTKFLISLLAISAGLTSGTLFIVRYSVQKQVRDSLQVDLQNSVKTYQSFDLQRSDALTHSAALLANLPNVRALMTTHDAATIQDATAEVWRQSGSDLLVFGSGAGEVLGIQTGSPGFDRATAEVLLARTLAGKSTRDWWLGSGHLFQVWIQPIYLGTAAEGDRIGLLVLGDEVDQYAAKQFGNLAAGEVAFYSGDTIIASTFAPTQQAALAAQLRKSPSDRAALPQEVQLGKERYLASTLSLYRGSGPSVSLSVLKSFDKATSFLTALNRVLLGLGLLSILAGSILVFVISHTFTRPLEGLVRGVRALDSGDFDYPLETAGGDEVAEVTATFDRMRANLQKTLSEQKQLEQRLRQAHKMEAIGRLAGGVAHDFNNLLTIIRGHGDILLDRAATVGSDRHSLEQIQKAANRAVSMTRQLLAFSRMQVLEPRIVDLNVVVADMGKMLPRLIGEHIEFSFNPGADVFMVKADPSQIEQVILNLVVNARDAMPQGGTISVRTSNAILDQTQALQRSPMTPGQYVLLSVTDTGHGMDETTKAHIFEPFFTTKELGKGTGLGLATVYGVVKQSGGFIWVESSPGKGTTFEIYLPKAQGKASESEAETKPSSIRRGSETILVVEDESGIRELACAFLRVNGYFVLEAKDGLEALDVVARHQGTVDLVLSDIVMPRMGGPELVGRLKALHPETRVIFMSGYAEYSGTDPRQTSPLPPVLQKPFSVGSLVEKIRQEFSRQPIGDVSGVGERSIT
jgi:two-component system cell cycle sensor histidine kinase/response regulator CckA